ncbi:MAG: response regulator [Desulfamplus sp.]|nr:response regulator [Desulfamplus sp.]
MTKQLDLKNMIAVSNKKALEWNMAQKRIEDIFTRFSNDSECSPDHIRNELNNELRRMWSDLETYKIELEMQNDELMRAFQDAENVRKDYVELFNSSPVGYLILNSSAIIINANQTFADMVKSQLTQIYQKPFQNFIAQKDVSDFLSRFKSYFRNPLEKFFELTLNDSRHNSIVVRLEGIRKHLSDFAKKGREEGGSIDVNFNNNVDNKKLDKDNSNIDNKESQEEVLLISLSDITLLKQAEEEKETLKNLLLHARKMEAMGTLAAGIAHDFNNILFPILGFGEMLKDELSQIQTIDDLTKQDDMVRMVDSIITNTIRAKTLVKQIFTFSKDTSTALGPLYLNMILMQILVSLRPALPTNIKLVDGIDNTCNMIMADAEKMHIVIMNLLTNAIESMDMVGGTLTITLTEDYFKENCLYTGASVNGKYVCLSVKDTGHGIETEHLSRIFDPYFSTRPKFKSGGLGLSLVHGIVSSHKGFITVKSELNKGSEFRIFFPPYLSSGDEQKCLTKKELPVGNEKILVIDDQIAITKVLSIMLQRLGYKVFTYNDPKAALDFMNHNRKYFDLILTDMTMPEMTGDEVARKAMSIEPKIPILILTGYSDKLSPEEALKIGVKGYLMKPISLADLAIAVRGALDV